jgi:hypothetical protein
MEIISVSFVSPCETGSDDVGSDYSHRGTETTEVGFF